MALFLIDGHALVYRAYFAFIRSPLTNSKGENTSAVYGFTRTLLQLIKKYRPEHLAVVFDSEEETERHRAYPEYKAHREEMPDEMSVQFPWIFDVIEAMGIAIVIKPGYEADDIIATLARKDFADGMDVKIVTSDKDLFQLLSAKVHILKPSKGSNFEDEIGPAYLEQRFGLGPDQIVDLLALMGDSSDNIPGVRGIGEKTALKLLHAFGSLDEILANTGRIEPRHVRDKIERDRDSALSSRDLVTLLEVPLDLTLEGLEVGEPDEKRLTELLIRFEFHQILREFSFGSKSAPKRVDYRCVDEQGLSALAGALGESTALVLDVETTSLDPLSAEIVGISFCAREGKSWYVPVSCVGDSEPGGLFDEGAGMGGGIPVDKVRNALGPVLSDASIGKIGHNIKYDSLVLEAHGFEVKGISFDTMIASYCLDPERRSHSLDTLALEFCRHTMISYRDLFRPDDKVRDIRSVPLEKLTRYSCEDADYTMRLKNIFDPKLDSYGVTKLFNEVEMPLALVLARMEREGVALDTGILESLSDGVTRDLDRLTSQIHEMAGEQFNINSSKQLQRILFEKLGLPVVRRTKTGFSTDVEVLRELAPQNEIAGAVLEHRQLSKLASTYLQALPKLVNDSTGRIHTSFNQTVTATGRLSSSEPNLQNIPIRTELGRRIRSAFVPREGNVLMDADYSQIELRILAHLSEDEALMEAFREGVDIHTRTAARINGVSEEEVDGAMRSRAKTINFGVVYGMGARGLARQLGIPVQEAKQFIEEYFSTYPGVKAFIDTAIENARNNMYTETLLGRRRLLPDINTDDGRVRSFSERIAVNTPIQGTAADMIKVAMVNIDRAVMERALGSRMILQVHDELVFDVPPAELDVIKEIVRSSMEAAIDLRVPIVVDIGCGKNWLEAHP